MIYGLENAAVDIYLPGIIIFTISLALVFFLTWGIIKIAPNIGWIAKSNNRSSHEGFLAFGGGAPLIIITLGMWLFFSKSFDELGFSVLLSAAILAIISAIDDIKPISSSIRIIFHIIAISICLYFLPIESRVFPVDLPIIIDRLLVGLFWLWFINLFNFMDGIDGLAASETFTISFGIILIAIFFIYPEHLLILSFCLSGAVLGFLPWNWHRAKIMLGDMGSIPIGFLLGFLLINLAIEGYFLAMVILPSYFVADASLTLIRRIVKGEKFWRPHRTHFYQLAVQSSKSHDKIVTKIILANIILIGAALLSISQPVIALVIALGVLLILMKYLSTQAKGRR